MGRVGDRAKRSAGGVRLFAAATTSAARGTRLMTGAAVTGAAAGAVAFGLFAKRAVDAATDVNESTTKNEVLFGRHAATISRFADTSGKTLGISRRAALESTGTFGNLFRALELGPKRSADMSVSLTKLAADLASFNNSTPEEALEAIRSGLVGETEPLRRFGVNLNDDALRAEALRKGLVKTTKQALTPQQKALAVNSLLFKQTAAAQGDFERTSGGLANQQRILKAGIDDVTATLGTAFLPLATRVVSTLNREVVPAFGHVASSIGKIWGEGGEDRTFAEKMRATGASAQHWLLDPLETAARDFWAQNREAIISGAESAVSSAGSRMADAAAAAAPHAAGAFVRAFKGAGVWGQLLTVALVSKKLGVFGTLGRLGCGRFGTSWKACAPGKLADGVTAATGGKGKGGGKLATAFRALGRFGGPLMAATALVEFVNYFASTEPGKQAESGDTEGVRPHHVVKPGEGQTGAEIAANRDPEKDPGKSRRGGGEIGAAPIAPIPRKSVTPFARQGAPVRGGGSAALFNVHVTSNLDGRQVGRGLAKVTADDLAGA